MTNNLALLNNLDGHCLATPHLNNELTWRLSIKQLMETQRPSLRSIRLLDQLRERMRYCHCSLPYRVSIRLLGSVLHSLSISCGIHGRWGARGRGVSDPFGDRRNVAPSTHKQALAAFSASHPALDRGASISSPCHESGTEM